MKSQSRTTCCSTLALSVIYTVQHYAGGSSRLLRHEIYFFRPSLHRVMPIPVSCTRRALPSSGHMTDLHREPVGCTHSAWPLMRSRRRELYTPLCTLPCPKHGIACKAPVVLLSFSLTYHHRLVISCVPCVLVLFLSCPFVALHIRLT